MLGRPPPRPRDPAFLIHPEPPPAPPPPPTLEERRAWRVVEIKAIAGQLITTRYPVWRQANMTARAVELLAEGQQHGPEAQALAASWAWIKAVRDRSEVLEQLVASAADPDAFVIDGWPEHPEAP